MTCQLFKEWLKEFDVNMQRRQLTVPSLLDNYMVHHVAVNLTSVKVPFLSPNVTAGFQPMDMCVIAIVKVSYRQHVVDRMIFSVD